MVSQIIVHFASDTYISLIAPFGTRDRRFFPRVAATMSSTKVIKKCRNKSYQYGIEIYLPKKIVTLFPRNMLH